MLAARGELTLNQRTVLTALSFSSRTVNRKPVSHCDPVNRPANSRHLSNYKIVFVKCSSYNFHSEKRQRRMGHSPWAAFVSAAFWRPQFLEMAVIRWRLMSKHCSFATSSAQQQSVCCIKLNWQEAQLSPRDRAMRRVNWNLANCHATVQKLLLRQVLTKSMVWSWRFSRRQCVIDNVHSTMTLPSRLPLSQVS